MPAPKRAAEDPQSINISINSSNGSSPTTHVKYGDKVQWTAPSDSDAWVIPPTCFRACTSKISIAKGTTQPNPACVVTGAPGNYNYSSGLGASTKQNLGAGDNDTIIVDSSQP